MLEESWDDEQQNKFHLSYLFKSSSWYRCVFPASPGRLKQQDRKFKFSRLAWATLKPCLKIRRALGMSQWSRNTTIVLF